MLVKRLLASGCVSLARINRLLAAFKQFCIEDGLVTPEDLEEVFGRFQAALSQ